MSKRPPWIKVRAPTTREAEGMRAMRDILQRHRLTTICQGALCPNAVECWGARTATFLLLGETCTRACRFCGVPTGNPAGALDADEPQRVADAAAELDLRHVVLTSVDRDDLLDGGAAAFAEAIRRVASVGGGIRVEALIPDFSGRAEPLDVVLAAGADVVAHNIETVRRLAPVLRDRRADYDRSLGVLERIALHGKGARVKSGLMVGLGETQQEIFKYHVIEPKQTRLEYRINNFLVKRGFGIEDWELRFKEIDVTDEAKVAEIIQKLVKLGVLTINEGRREMGQKPLDHPGADVPFMMTSTGPLSLDTLAEGGVRPRMMPGGTGKALIDSLLTHQDVIREEIRKRGEDSPAEADDDVPIPALAGADG